MELVVAVILCLAMFASWLAMPASGSSKISS
jgi:hypothetical protein